MPAVSTGKVLVTGANGYVAVWIIKLLLEAGYSVRGTVRSENKTAHLRTLFQSFGDKLELVIVPDMTSAEAFAPYVKDVDAIAHTASPFHMNAVEPEEIISPAVAGTVSVLKAASAHATVLKRVIVLSSTAALSQPTTVPIVLDETAWGDHAIAVCKDKGRDAAAFEKYRASKTLAERAAWEWYEAHKSEGWDLVSLNPPYVYGPVLNEVDKPENLSESSRDWYFNVVKGKMDNEKLATVGSSFVDVRDIALAHLLAFQKPEAGGERIIVSSHKYKWQDFVSSARRLSNKIPEGNTAYDPSQAPENLTNYNNKKSIELLGIKYRNLDETTKDSLDDFMAKGWL